MKPICERWRAVLSIACLTSLAWIDPAGAAPDEPKGAAEERQAVLELGSDVWPPFTDLPNQRRIAIDLVQEALQRAGIRATTRILDDFEQVTRELREGTLDGSAALWLDPDRERLLLFSKPYLENRLVLLTRKGGDLGATSLAELSGRRVAVVQGYSYGDAIEQVEGPVLVWGRSDQENLERLLTGEVDYLLADEVLIQGLFERYGARAEALLAVGSAPIVERSLHFAVRRDLPGAGSIIARFEAAIHAMIADGSYNRILGMTWIRADVDGDGRSELVLGGRQAGESAPKGSYEVFTRDGARAKTGAAEAEDAYVVDGKIYHNWKNIPSHYRVPPEPRTRPIDRKGDSPEPGISIFRF